MFKIHKFLTLYNSVFFYLYHLLKILLIPYLKIEKKLFLKKGLIIDLGCSYGLLTNILAFFNKNRKLIGLDYNKNRIKKSICRFKKYKYIKLKIYRKLQSQKSIVFF